MVSGLYLKIKQNYVEGGVTQVLKKSIKKIGYFLYHTNNAYWFRLDLQDEIIDFPHDADVSINFNNPYETIQYIKDYGYYYPKEIEVGLPEGHIYSNIKYKGKIIGYNKTGFSRVYIEDFKRVYQFPENVAYTYDTFIDPEYRGRKYGAILLSEVCKYLQQRGFKSMWGHIPPWNKASESMHRKLGFKRYRLITYYSMIGISWTTDDPVKFIQHVEDIIKINNNFNPGLN